LLTCELHWRASCLKRGRKGVGVEEEEKEKEKKK
jgi:hypothetical protein